MASSAQVKGPAISAGRFPYYGWIGAGLTILFWILNWALSGLRTQWAFFPMWLGYCLTVDALARWRSGTSLLTRSWRRYVGLFAVSAPMWWMFEALNLRTQNWIYLGIQDYPPMQYAFWTTLSFSTVVPAVFGSAELVSGAPFIKKLPRGPVVRPDLLTTRSFFLGGWIMLALVLIWPRHFFPFIWISLYCIFEPLNVWLGHRSLAEWTERGDWRPVIALWLGVLMTGFFWEMWNFLSYPKWIYSVGWGNALHVFEMPLLGYGGYLPFSLELFAAYHLVLGVLGRRERGYVQVVSD